MQLSLNQIAIMCNGVLTDGSNGALIVNHVAIDSHELEQGSLFIAIIGHTNDGHKFVHESLQNGAVGAIVNQSSKLALPNLIIVEDTTIAIGLFAKNYRDMFDISVVAITGSNGKTTIKEMLKRICEIEYGVDYVLASRGSFNNHWGMPLSLLQLNTKHKVAILEMGMNHHGELDYLSKIAKPTIAVVNNVLMSHAGFFKDLSDIAYAKGEIYNGLTDNGTALINKSVQFADIWQDQLKHQNCRIIEYGTLDTTCYLKECM
ncbi:MAG: UDP-N-acetylmuramoyl-tripeptide--D-alanyl-D-alanine ligase, partial [Burkholderiales bacterium]|nr:UDP-N-acetylmuramoyl-tripeptide--D-alanyl-D-alanine ligase [Burkholderiales bacterium]